MLDHLQLWVAFLRVCLKQGYRKKMKILMVNNQLSVLGGSETYMFSVGEELSRRGHDVQYFGKKSLDSKHTNSFGIYARNSLNPFSIIVNKRNVKFFGRILDLYKPDIIHINLMYFVLTPQIINEAVLRNIPIIHTVHDAKIVCPNHRLYDVDCQLPCMDCLYYGYKKCVEKRCIKKSKLLSKLAVKESVFYDKNGLYNKIDTIIFPSNFMKQIHIEHGISKKQAVVLHNFTRLDFDKTKTSKSANNKYVLYFGRLSVEKGMKLLAATIEATPDISYIIAGDGPCSKLFNEYSNCKCVGFVTGEKLVDLIQQASICVFPSIWYENCPMSILESIALGTPVIGSNIGGIPELINDGFTGYIFNPFDLDDFVSKLTKLYNDESKLIEMSMNCLNTENVRNVSSYVDELEIIYKKAKEAHQ